MPLRTPNSKIPPKQGFTGPCYLCGGRKFAKRSGAVRDNPAIGIFECVSCGLVLLSSFDHISKDFYASSKMHDDCQIDTKTWLKEAEADDARRYRWLAPLIKKKSVLDFGCGAGGFLTRAKKIARRAAGVEPQRSLAPHFSKQRIRVFPSVEKIKGAYNIITLFHVLEHLPDPAAVLRSLAGRLEPRGRLIIEVPSANDALLTLYNSRAFSNFTYWSCHLFLFTPETLSALAVKAGLRTDYIKQVQRYSLANHLYWLSRGKPGGHKIWRFINSRGLHRAYERQLSAIGRCDTIAASFSVNPVRKDGSRYKETL
jgi:SAM-dependent methyltransferase